MTEFFDLGQNCAVCNMRDYLPFNCDKCHKSFCLDHRAYTSHNCDKFETTRPTIQCPLCLQNVLIEGVDPNRSVERHIIKGCQKEIKDRQKCHLKDCSETAFVECKQCQYIYCLKHRLDLDHSCPKMPKLKETIIPRSKPTIPAFSNTRKDPIGSQNIEIQDRFELDVYFPRTSGKKPFHMFFSKNWKIGKILDLICKQGGIINENLSQRDEEKKLHLFHVSTKKILPPSEYLKDVNWIKRKDVVILEYGTKLEFTLEEVIEVNSCILQ